MLRGFIVYACLILALATPSFAAITAPATQPATLPATARPADRTIRLQPGNEIHSAAFAPDGQTLYVSATVYDVNVTPVLLRAWPEAVAIVIGLWALGRIWRQRRRRVAAGVEHCRRCDYQLTGLGSDRCPECGMQLTPRNRVRARSLRRRAVVPAVVLGLVAGGYVVARSHAPRDVAVPERFHWRSVAPATWAIEDDISWLRPHLARRDVLLAVDPRTGGVRRVVCSEPVASRRAVGPWGEGEQLAVAPDGRTLAAWDGVRPEYRLIDVATGRMLHSVGPIGRTTAFSPDGQQLVTADDRGRIWGWDVRTGDRRSFDQLPPLPKELLKQYPAARRFVSGPASQRRNRMELLLRGDRLMAVEYLATTRDERDYVHHARLDTINAATGQIDYLMDLGRTQVGAPCTDLCPVKSHADGYAIALGKSYRPDSIRLLDSNAAPTAVVALPRSADEGRIWFERIDTPPNGRVVLAMFKEDTAQDRVVQYAVCNASTGQWVDLLDTACDHVYSLQFATDSSAAVALSRPRVRNAGSRVDDQLIVFDLKRYYSN